MEQPGDGHEAGEDTGVDGAVKGEQRAPEHHRAGDHRLDHRQVPFGEMEGAAGQSRGHEGQRQQVAAREEGADQADRQDEGQMVQADDRMPQSGEQTLREGLRHLVVHRVMREGRSGTQRKRRKAQDAGAGRT